MSHERLVKRGARFEHARQITGSPKAGTARPVVCVITRVTKTGIYYRPDDGGTSGLWTVGHDQVDSIVGCWL